MVVMTSKNFWLNILEECLVQGISLPNSQSGRAPSIDSLDRLSGLQSSPDRSPIGKVKEAAGQVRLQYIKNLVKLAIVFKKLKTTNQ